MKLLLDTHTFIWWDSAPGNLSATVLTACRNPTNTLWLSVISVWEIQIKLQLGKLQLHQPLEKIVEEQKQNNNLQVLPVTLKHVLAVGDLPLYHKDLFDRLLIAQAKVEEAPLVSKDTEFPKYCINLLW